MALDTTTLALNWRRMQPSEQFQGNASDRSPLTISLGNVLPLSMQRVVPIRANCTRDRVGPSFRIDTDSAAAEGLPN